MTSSSRTVYQQLLEPQPTEQPTNVSGAQNIIDRSRIQPPSNAAPNRYGMYYQSQHDRPVEIRTDPHKKSLLQQYERSKQATVLHREQTVMNGYQDQLQYAQYNY
mmetsp:Transcript_579/g.1084  ORF Transcript_579/g.1084 Transcript_579/m.1084 type:complete len:105 (+) Transcript_579:48-362(+)